MLRPKQVLSIIFAIACTWQIHAACPNLNLSFVSPTQSGCGVPQYFSFNNTSTGTNANNVAYIWKIDGIRVDSTFSTVPHFNYTFGGPGTFVVRMVAITAGNCRDSIQQSVTITSLAPLVYDGNLALTFTPRWSNCIINPLQNDNYNISISSNVVLNNYTVIWGDATANNTGASLTVGNPINHTYTSLGLFTVKIITVNGGCSDTISGTVVNMRPVSTSIKPLPAGQLAGCAPHTITFQDTTQFALPGTVLTWNFGDGTIITRNWTQANQPITHTYLPTGNGNCIYTVSLSAFNTNCNTGTNNASVFTISPILIFDKDVAQINPPSNLCQPSLTYTFGNSSQDNCISGNRYYYWSFGDGTNTGWITSKGPQTHTFPSLGQYTIMLIDSNNCGSDTTFATVTINAPPIVGFTMTPKFGCAPLTITLSDTSLGTGNTRFWTLLGTTPNSSTAATLNRTYNNPGTYVVRLSVSNICATGIIRTDTVRVYAKPNVSIGNAIAGCVPHTVQLQNNTANQSANATYFWDFGNGVTSTQRNPPQVTYATTGTFTVKLVVTDTCGKDSQMVNIAVSTLPVVQFTATTVCRGQATTFTNSSVLAPGDVVSNFRWIYGNGDSINGGTAVQNYTYPASGDYNAILQVTTDKNCVSRDTIPVNVKAAPVVNFNNTAPPICDGAIVAFNGTASTQAPSTITAYRWSFGTTDTARSEDTVYRFPSPATYPIIYTVTNDVGCSTSVNSSVIVHPMPDSRLVKTIACRGQRTQFGDSSIVGFGNTITQWAWDFDNNGITDSTTQHPYYIFNTTGTFKTKLTVTTNNGCSNTDSINTVVNATPTAAPSTNVSSICKNDSFNLINSSIGAFAYAWYLGNGSGELFVTTTAPIKYAYADTGSYTIKLIAISLQGCRDSNTTSIVSRPLPVAQFTVNDTIGCAPKTFAFTNNSILANGYKWLVGNEQSSTATNRTDTLIALSGQVVPIKLIATNQFNCRPDTTVKTLYTFGNPTPNFTTSVDSGCGPLSVSFFNTTPNGISYKWRLGNGDTAITTNAASVYLPSLLNDSIFNIKLIASNGPGCSDSITKTIRVFPKPTAQFTHLVNNGCAPLQVAFNNTSNHKFGGNINDMSFNWNFGNSTSSTQQNPSLAYLASNIQDTVYNITLIAQSRFGCADTAKSSVRVYPKAKATFSVNNPSGCGPHTTAFTNTSIPNDTGSIAIMNFNWHFANGLTSTSPQSQSVFTASKTIDSIYQIRLIAFSEHGCADTAFQDVRVYPNPNAVFTPSVNSGCGPLSVNFANTSIPNDTGTINNMSFVWNFGNGFNSVTQNGSSQFTARLLNDTPYTIRLTAYSEHGCVDTTSRQIIVRPNPLTAFVSNKTAGCGPLAVQFTNTTQLGHTYYWNFGDGDGDTTSATNPSHQFLSYQIFDSIYQVKLASKSIYGCLGDTVSTSIIARYDPIADFFPSADSICGSGTVAFFNSSLGGTQNSWNFGNTQTSPAINPVTTFAALPNKDTAYQVKLVITSPYGCKDSVTKQVKVNALPDAAFNAIVPGCNPYPVTLSNNSQRAVKYEWDFGDATSDSIAIPTKVFTNTLSLVNRIYPVTLKVISAGGCIDTAKRNVIVYPLPNASITVQKTLRCDTAEYSFLNATQGASSYLWRFGDGYTSNVQSPLHYYKTSSTNDITYNIRMISTSANGCLDSADAVATVHPLVIADLNTITTSSCQNLDVLFQNLSRNANNYFWLFGDGAGTNEAVPSHKYSNTGAYNVTLIAYDQFGCSDTAVKPAYINIYEIPNALFSFDPINPQQPNTLVNFNNLSTIGSGTLSHTWNFGDPASGNNASNLTNPTHNYSDSGNYTIQLAVSSNQGCKDTLERNIRVSPRKPIPDFDYDPSQGCKPLTVTFTNKSLYAYTYRWDFGDGTRSAEENPVHLYTRNDSFTVELTAYGPGGDSTIEKINIIAVHDLPKARFTANPTEIFLPDAFSTFTNTSFDALKNYWTVLDEDNNIIFEDTNYNSGFNFTDDGLFSLQLIVQNQFGCVDTAYGDKVINVDKSGTIFIPNAFTPNGDNKNEVFIPVITGVRKQGYELRVYDRWGKLVFSTTDPYKGWDGLIKNKPAATDVYVWIMEGTFVTNNRFTKNGTVTLLR